VTTLIKAGPREFFKRVSHYVGVTPKFLYYKFLSDYTIEIRGEKMEVNISDYFGDYREAVYFERNEKELMSDIISECSEESVYLDVGANIGLSSILVSDVLKTVFSIEPHPANCSHMLKNMEINNSNIDIYQCALSDSSGFLKLGGTRGGFLADGSAALVSEGIDIPSKAGPSQGITKLNVHIKKGDELVTSELGVIPNIIKIDVEGAEMDVINGLSNTLADDSTQIVYIELHEKGKYTSEDIISDLKSFGFSIEKRDRYIKANK
jgi:FkbM family methyltransferase